MPSTPAPIPTLPPTLPKTAGALRALLLAAWAERDSVIAERDSVAAERDSIAAERDALTVQNDRLRHLLLKLKRMQFGAIAKRSHGVMSAKLTGPSACPRSSCSSVWRISSRPSPMAKPTPNDAIPP